MARRTSQFTLRRFWNSVFDSLTLQKQQQYELHECRYYWGLEGAVLDFIGEYGLMCCCKNIIGTTS